MKIQQLIYFREVAVTLHFTKAADNLFVSQSSLSHAIQSLEEELGVPLFIRKNGRKVNLSPYGETLLPYAEHVMETMENAQNAIKQLQNPVSGIVKVAFSYVNGISLIPSLFRDFRNDNRNVDIDIRFSVNNMRTRFEEELLTGGIDLAFSCTSSYKGLEVLPIAKQELVVMLPAGHPLASRKSLTVEDIKDEVMIGYDRNWNMSNWIDALFAEHGYKPDIVAFLSDWPSQMAHIAIGTGIAILPRIPVDPALISIVPLDDPKKYRDVYMLWNPEHTPSPAVEFVKNYCMNYFFSEK